jgi:hypothetical protein
LSARVGVGAVPRARGWPPVAWWDGGCAVGDLDGFGGELGEDLRKPPTDASPSAEIEFTLSKKWFSRRFPSAMPAPVGCGGVHRTRQ